MITEKLLQFIWQFRYFNQDELRLTNGEAITVLHPGRSNPDQGPDFLMARIRLGSFLWTGPVELHCKTSHWHRHAHQQDPNYSNLILHVVWENDLPQSIHPLPVLELCNRVPKLLLHQYESWMNSRAFIPCQHQLRTVHPLVWIAWKDRLLADRITQKAAQVELWLQQNQFHWEETCWWLLARQFGGKVNGEAFEAIARSLPIALLARHRHQLPQLEALLLGQAWLLEKPFREAYPKWLQQEYRFYRNKYGLVPNPYPVHFLRMRPVSFPTLRLAQLAMLLHRSGPLFSIMKEARSVRQLRQWLQPAASAYWDTHYTLDQPAAAMPKRLGGQVADSIIINAVIPVLFAYGKWRPETGCQERVQQWLEELPAEANTITRQFEQLGITCRHAADSQALIALKTAWCDPKKCLQCPAGVALLKTSSQLKRLPAS
ncbi:MAG: DUF2851 family protein [Candidatus Pseudobacter hemicellulosilyticus]|uniref:DUF2851 family protein n=1 Tax=Candidatus Pseudobacter hemicellulosilyticus TaxID=3121375 RepID=A0AAJ6BFM5_9BACT|nr:MAG: DUF2851 family protein [Pseudobacter sp.]